MKFSILTSAFFGAATVAADYADDVRASGGAVDIARAFLANPPVLSYKSEFVDSVIKHTQSQVNADLEDFARRITLLALDALTPAFISSSKKNTTLVFEATETARRVAKSLHNATDVILSKPVSEQDRKPLSEAEIQEKKAAVKAVLPPQIQEIILSRISQLVAEAQEAGKQDGHEKRQIIIAGLIILFVSFLVIVGLSVLAILALLFIFVVVPIGIVVVIFLLKEGGVDLPLPPLPTIPVPLPDIPIPNIPLPPVGLTHIKLLGLA
ncbi:hypothetical protein NLG97_g8172 [Lecanicillium saksenae]|uniref:Uncharacterized protein n=1 Tax=Lecanicillium saksenae TaxID=468837 RepID=A0ACC1QMP7_9HYPO|nr:hypothetical protein NLG97_g8172 [Lecanicillium saksenae]